jgi:hypothetical protein
MVRALSAANRRITPFLYVLTRDGMVCVNCADTVANVLPGVWANADPGEKQAGAA